LPAATQCSVPDSGQTLQSAATDGSKAGLALAVASLAGLLRPDCPRANRRFSTDRPVENFSGLVFLEGANRPIGRHHRKTSGRLSEDLSPAFLTDRAWGAFQVRGLGSWGVRDRSWKNQATSQFGRPLPALWNFTALWSFISGRATLRLCGGQIYAVFCAGIENTRGRRAMHSRKDWGAVWPRMIR